MNFGSDQNNTVYSFKFTGFAKVLSLRKKIEWGFLLAGV